MRVSVNANIWELIENEGKATQVRASESRKNNRSGSYETINNFRAVVRGQALEYLNSIRDQIPAQGEHKKAPWVRLDGFLERRGMKREDGTYNNEGYITFTKAGPGGSDLAATTQAPQASDKPAADDGGFFSLPEDLPEELPFA